VGNFDIDLDFGQIYEEKVRDIFEGDGSIEVKTERDIWASTGNMALEIRCRGELSGLSITDAKWWIHIFTIDGDMKYMLALQVSKLRKIIKYMFINDLARIIKGGDDDESQMVLAPIRLLIDIAKKV
tara:strand:- start:82 stop:462 length:381 start_codon:yes stop_codon:yes gene_type:complete